MTNENHFIKFHVENFKRFDELTLENLGQFNVIVGDNNVGKSSVLEALMFNKYFTDFMLALFRVLYLFKHFDGLHEWFMLQYLKSAPAKNADRINFEATLADNSTINRTLLFLGKNFYQWLESKYDPYQGQVVARRLEDGSEDNNNSTLGDVPYVPFQLAYSHQITDFYSKNIQPLNSRKEQFLNDLKTIIPDIKNLEINTVVANQPIILVSRINADSNLPLATYGDGVIKLFRILIEMQIHAGKRLMIDEIDTGIHFSRMKLFWKTVILSARNNNVQLFATTHSDECIQCFKETLEELDQTFKDDARVIHLEEIDHEKQQVKAYTYKFNEFGHALEIGNELR